MLIDTAMENASKDRLTVSSKNNKMEKDKNVGRHTNARLHFRQVDDEFIIIAFRYLRRVVPVGLFTRIRQFSQPMADAIRLMP